MKILTLTSLYPNAAMPSHGVFVENRIRAFIDKSGADVRVCAPVPWFPLKSGIFGKYARWARAPQSEMRSGITVAHPRYFIPPKVGMTYAVEALEGCFRKAAEKAIDDGWDFDLIDAHYLYPDGVAAVRVARQLGKPVVITARGKKIEVMRNGVDLNKFQPFDRAASRAKFNLGEEPALISVGHLIDRKGHDLVIEALTDIPEATLLIAGDGDKRASLTTLAQTSGVANRVRFLGEVSHDELASVYSAADCLILASSREGWPNVLLEAMACGAPAIAAPVSFNLALTSSIDTLI